MLGYQLAFNDGYVYLSIVCDCHEKAITLTGNKFFLMSKLLKKTCMNHPKSLKSDEISTPKNNSKRFGGFLKPTYDIISLIIS